MRLSMRGRFDRLVWGIGLLACLAAASGCNPNTVQTGSILTKLHGTPVTSPT